MNVARILKEKGSDIAMVQPDTRLMDVVNMLADKRIGAVIVCDASEHIEGIVSERDIVRVLATNGPGALNEPASNHMTREVQSCRVNDTVEWLMETMTTQRFRHMPVVDNDRIVGVVSIGDVVKQRIALAEMEAASMRDYIKTG